LKRKGFFISGTDTCVGKTSIAAALALTMKRKGVNVGVMKPFATAERKYSATFYSEDVMKLAMAADVSDGKEQINPFFSSLPTAPYTATLVGKSNKVRFSSVVEYYRELASIHDIMIVEGIGGILVPLTRTKNVADFAKATNLPVIVVAKFRLGMINQVLLTLAACHNYNLKVEGIILNDLSCWDGVIKKKAIIKTIEKVSGVHVLATVPFIENASPDVVALKLASHPSLARRLVPSNR
jgi:dethiobiotin synthetase